MTRLPVTAPGIDNRMTEINIRAKPNNCQLFKDCCRNKKESSAADNGSTVAIIPTLPASICLSPAILEKTPVML